jgi:DNA-binding transcriptional MocR family regulator
MADWVARSSGVVARAERVMLTAGAQQAMALAFAAVCRPGDTVLCEAATYFGMKTCRACRLRLVGVAMDAEGLLPDCAGGRRAGARALFILPTVQNPPAGSWVRPPPPDRRRRPPPPTLDVEDDVYAGYAPRHEPIANLAPELTFFLTSMSEGRAPWLRAGALIAPAGGGHDRALRGLQALSVAGAASAG